MLEIRGIRKSFQGREVLHETHLTIASGEFFSLLGPSGCGKTTLLRILAGLEDASGGEIWLDGQRIDLLPPQRRPFNLVFQKHALFPHLSVAENVAFGLRMKRAPAAEIRDRVQKVLNLVGLADFARRRPETLSGGQSQRVALARALINEPRVLLLDEPLSALDLKMRAYMQTELKALQKRLGITFVSVTHDQDEALALSDRIGLMNAGSLEQVSTPREIYDSPKSSFTAGFVGRMSRLRGELVSLQGTEAQVRLADETLVKGRFADLQNPMAPGRRVEVLVRPEKIRLLTGSEPAPPLMNQLSGDLSECVFKGDHTEFHVQSGCGSFLQANDFSDRHERPIGESVRLAFAPADTFFFAESEE